MAKTMQEVQQDYNVACAELGQAVYKVAALESEIGSTERSIGLIKQRLKELNERAAKLSKAPEAAEATDEQPQG
jgi:septal ring factor EnvC (AmiA/AmiB activator)